jgi:hypothetical protein
MGYSAEEEEQLNITVQVGLYFLADERHQVRLLGNTAAWHNPLQGKSTDITGEGQRDVLRFQIPSGMLRAEGFSAEVIRASANRANELDAAAFDAAKEGSSREHVSPF